MDAESNLEAIERKKIMKKIKGSPWHPEPFFDHMDKFLTSDTSKNQSYIIMYADYGFINDNKHIFTKEIS